VIAARVLRGEVALEGLRSPDLDAVEPCLDAHVEPMLLC